MDTQPNVKRVRPNFEEEITSGYNFVMNLIPVDVMNYINVSDNNKTYTKKISRLRDKYISKLSVILQTVPSEQKQHHIEELQQIIINEMQVIIESVKKNIVRLQNKSHKETRIQEILRQLGVPPNFPIDIMRESEIEFIMENEKYRKILEHIINTFNAIVLETNDTNIAYQYAFDKINKLGVKIGDYKTHRKSHPRVREADSKEHLYMLTRKKFAESGIIIPDDFPYFYMDEPKTITDVEEYRQRLISIIDKFNEDKQMIGLEEASKQTYARIRGLTNTASKNKRRIRQRLLKSGIEPTQDINYGELKPRSQKRRLSPEEPTSLENPEYDEDFDFDEFLRETTNYYFDRQNENRKASPKSETEHDWENMPNDFGISGQHEWDTVREENKGGRKKQTTNRYKRLRKNKCCRKTLKKKRNT